MNNKNKIILSFLMLIFVISMLVINWNINIENEEIVTKEISESLSCNAITKLKRQGILKSNVKITDYIKRESLVEYKLIKTNIPYIYKKDTIIHVDWNYVKYN